MSEQRLCSRAWEDEACHLSPSGLSLMFPLADEVFSSHPTIRQGPSLMASLASKICL